MASKWIVMSAVQSQQQDMPKCYYFHYSGTYLYSLKKKKTTSLGLTSFVINISQSGLHILTVVCEIILGSILR